MDRDGGRGACGTASGFTENFSGGPDMLGKKPFNGLAGKRYNVMLTRTPQDRQADAKTSLGVGPQAGTAGLPNWMIC